MTDRFKRYKVIIFGIRGHYVDIRYTKIGSDKLIDNLKMIIVMAGYKPIFYLGF